MSQKNYNAHIDETYAIIKTSRKLTGLSMPNTEQASSG
ncbi:hypothetical protein BTN50_0114 [Candidatus Enterovibrio altilux]|uniref:Mobile element protein n=1 Tax=Candidatus Enterovibrio altilux TaxID=1927128 RepID=A0A291B6N9_9GAMM|nr:hypothetical protein BTN50_0114 [Candidatus Enterovibrio luxaltus]